MTRDPAFTRRLLLGRGAGAASLIWPALASAQPPARHPGAAPHHVPQSAPGPALGTGPERSSGRRPLVVLDPGHGGKDPGAIGIAGTYEKHIALATASALRQHLLAGGRYRVAMTRQVDDFIPLGDRVDIAQSQGASLFLSIHADALPDPHVRGASVYTLAISASDAQTVSLAARENSVDRYGGIKQAGLSPHVAQRLASLVRHETRIGSARLQRQAIASLAAATPLLDNPFRHAAFAVLKAADIPSILVEMGFLSNPHDEAALRREAHRATIVIALNRAIDEYFASASRLSGEPV